MRIIESYNHNVTGDLIAIKSATYMGNYIIHITFNDSTEKSVDFKPFLSKSLHPSISKYLDEHLLQQFEIKNGNLNWNDYDLIFPVYDLHEGKIH